MNPGQYPALFLDRDGVIIENRADYVRSWEDVHIYPQALAALGHIHAAPYQVIIVTNQSAVGRGLITLEMAREINQRLIEMIQAAGGRVDHVYMCPHAPEENCECRKPKPGLLLRAAQDLNLDLSRSILVGDAFTDLLAGQAAGLGKTALVRTGRGASQANLPRPAGLKPFPIYENLSAALSCLIQ